MDKIWQIRILFAGILFLVIIVIAIFAYAAEEKPKGEISWAYEGTYCKECNYVYDYGEKYKICPKCDTITKDVFILRQFRDRL